MMNLATWLKPSRTLGVSTATWAAVVLVACGFVLGVTVHKAFLVLFAAGAWGPLLLRQLGWLRDMDELQRTASAEAGLRAYLATAFFLFCVVLGRGWSTLSLGDDEISASSVLTLMLVVYYASYCLSFWDARPAVSLVLLAFGAFWTWFVVASHGGEPWVLMLEGLAVPAPFLLSAWLLWKWPRVVAVLLLLVAAAAVFAFRLPPLGPLDRVFVFFLIPLPLVISAFALFSAASREEDPRITR